MNKITCPLKLDDSNGKISKYELEVICNRIVYTKKLEGSITKLLFLDFMRKLLKKRKYLRTYIDYLIFLETYYYLL